jgi:hypothetical protein
LSRFPFHRALVACALALASACVAPEPTRARPGIATTNTVPIEEQAAAAEEASRPGERHAELNVLVGEWNTTTVEIGEGGAERDPRHGQAKIAWTLSKHYLRWDASLVLGQREHHSTGLLGYDLFQREYQLLVVSDLATGMGVARGQGQLASGGIRFVLEIVDRETGALRRATSVLRQMAPDHFVLDQYGLDKNGEERVVRKTHYRRGA